MVLPKTAAEIPAVHQEMSATSSSIISGTPLTNGSCTRSTASSSNTHVSTESSQYGAMTRIWFAMVRIFNCYLRRTTDVILSVS